MDTEQSVINVAASVRRRLAPEDRRSEIIGAALKLFVEHGYAATKLDDVAKAVGVSKGLPYRYFESKEELFKAVVREAIVTPLAEAEEKFGDYDGPIADLLRVLVCHHAVFSKEIGGGVAKLMMAEAANFPEIARFYMLEVVDRARRFLADLVARGVARGEFREVDVEAMGRVIGAPLTMQTIFQHSLAPFDPDPMPDRFFGAYLDLVLAGLKR